MKAGALKKGGKLAKGTKKVGVSKAATKAAAPAPSDDFSKFSSSEDEDDNEAGFESSDDEEEFEDGYEDDAMDDTPATVKKTAVAKSNRAVTKASKKPGSGVIYLGRIPHGFYEEQMHSYFSQFGDISRLRLSRNKTTGASKHYAFIEFESKEVAQVAAETMNNYLLFGHILKCKVVPDEEVHEALFEGANKTFRVLPRAQVAQYKNERPRSRAKWDQLKKESASLLDAKMKKLGELGIDYKYSPVADVRVPKKAAAGLAEGAKKKKQRTSLA
ncbi:putative RNA-binding protein [Yarrowia sp. B02]|nr:putative RNA-binding protein [Yarrowia sp. B02]